MQCICGTAEIANGSALYGGQGWGTHSPDLSTQGLLPSLDPYIEFHPTREGFLEAVMLPPDLREG